MEAKGFPATLGRVGGTAALVLAGLLYLQFALQALFAAPPQGVLVLLGAAAFAVATTRFIRHQELARVVFMGTVPLFVFSLVTTFIYADESLVFAVIFAIAPALSGSAWMLRRSTSREVEVT